MKDGILKRGKELQCIWCNSIILMKKTILRCLECQKCFCINHSWSNQISISGILTDPKHGTKERKGVVDD